MKSNQIKIILLGLLMACSVDTSNKEQKAVGADKPDKEAESKNVGETDNKHEGIFKSSFGRLDVANSQSSPAGVIDFDLVVAGSYFALSSIATLEDFNESSITYSFKSPGEIRKNSIDGFVMTFTYSNDSWEIRHEEKSEMINLNGTYSRLEEEME